jgi:hypothetical protein
MYQNCTVIHHNPPTDTLMKSDQLIPFFSVIIFTILGQVSPEMHGTITGTFKNQIDWIPLNTGSVSRVGRSGCIVLGVCYGKRIV